eukprot:6460686-Amphidinium_carterae.5
MPTPKRNAMKISATTMSCERLSMFRNILLPKRHSKNWHKPKLDEERSQRRVTAIEKNNGYTYQTHQFYEKKPPRSKPFQ